MIAEGLQYTEIIKLETIVCCKCGIAFGVPSNLLNSLKANPKQTFYCPNGHPMCYTKSTEDNLREKLAESEKLRLSQNEGLSKMIMNERQEKEKYLKKLKRVHNGVCPCCKRSFLNLQKHMATKHPQIIKESLIPYKLNFRRDVEARKYYNEYFRIEFNGNTYQQGCYTLFKLEGGKSIKVGQYSPLSKARVKAQELFNNSITPSPYKTK